VPKYERVKLDGKLTGFEPALHQALTTTAIAPSRYRAALVPCLPRYSPRGYHGGYRAATDYIRRPYKTVVP